MELKKNQCSKRFDLIVVSYWKKLYSKWQKLHAHCTAQLILLCLCLNLPKNEWKTYNILQCLDTLPTTATAKKCNWKVCCLVRLSDWPDSQNSSCFYSYVFLPCELTLQKIQGVQNRLVLKKMLKNVLKEPDTETEYLRMPLEVMWFQ